ncbi:hypothetical protein ACFQOY_13790 [Enterococcus alcedinis]|uniref:Uncharacterized protein n=1 Tax=Enterococcus alcedinis TaxID=1274384 RepID=A0A917JCJ8_9ENTE|nr:hypothetical protein [Enterococcus alcedinis]MBP2100982.1 hypothetical protein [Enterococcus alcedinis]GGI64720.1 hypothetical protein GCM10011482_03740 [Enterococcus alcedinis]
MKDYVGEYRIKRIEFEMFCDVRKWTIDSFRSNDKNPSQYIGRCIDDEWKLRTFVITKKGNYIEYCGPGKGTVGKDKAWVPIEYVLNKSKESFDPVERETGR